MPVMSHLSLLSPCDMALCQCVFVPPLSSLRPKVSCITDSPRREEREGCISVARSPHCTPSLLLSIICWLWQLYPLCHALFCLLCLFVKHHTTVAMTLLCLWKKLTVYITGHVVNVQTGRTLTHLQYRNNSFAHACLHTKRSLLLGWPLNGFDTHYQLSLMWN